MDRPSYVESVERRIPSFSRPPPTPSATGFDVVRSAVCRSAILTETFLLAASAAVAGHYLNHEGKVHPKASREVCSPPDFVLGKEPLMSGKDSSALSHQCSELGKELLRGEKDSSALSRQCFVPA